MKNIFILKRQQVGGALISASTRLFIQTLLASWLIALGAQIAVPFYPIKMTLQTFVIALIGLCSSVRVSMNSVLLYLGYAAMGLPVLAGGNSGLISLWMGPSAGYLWGFIGMAGVISLLMRHYPSKNSIHRFIIACLGNIPVYVLGIIHLASLYGMKVAIKTGLMPFIMMDSIKMMLAVAVSLAISSGYSKQDLS
jgi:biotin transport system substrate-specific component